MVWLRSPMQTGDQVCCESRQGIPSGPGGTLPGRAVKGCVEYQVLCTQADGGGRACRSRIASWNKEIGRDAPRSGGGAPPPGMPPGMRAALSLGAGHVFCCPERVGGLARSKVGHPHQQLPLLLDACMLAGFSALPLLLAVAGSLCTASQAAQQMQGCHACSCL